MSLIIVQCAILLFSFLAQYQCYVIITPLSQTFHQVAARNRRFPLVASASNDDDIDFEGNKETTGQIVGHHEEASSSSSSSSAAAASNIITRRRALGSLVVTSIGPIPTSPILSARAAAFIEQQEKQQPELEQSAASFNANCLTDLPPIPSGFVRVYLCRHGQTENNRLHLMQGARVDPAINDTGMAQAQRLGTALANAAGNNAEKAAGMPELILHSKLLRAQQTASIASRQFITKQQQQQQQQQRIPKLTTLDALGEVDFGAVAEGLPVEQVRSQLVATYAGWATGNLDMGMQGGGETGRQVLLHVWKSPSIPADY
jgi:broad specificity phosphatase PhoE